MDTRSDGWSYNSILYDVPPCMEGIFYLVLFTLSEGHLFKPYRVPWDFSLRIGLTNDCSRHQISTKSCRLFNSIPSVYSIDFNEVPES